MSDSNAAPSDPSPADRNVVGNTRFRELLNRVAAGDATAMPIIIEEYGSHIMRVVRRQISSRVRSQYDSEDFVQAVWASFFGHLSVVQRISTDDDFGAFLRRMASNKVIDAGRRAMNPAAPQVSEDGDLDHLSTQQGMSGSDATASQVAVAREEWEKLVANETDRAKQVLRLRESGATQGEIARLIGLSERHVRRILGRISRKRGDSGPASA